MKKTTSNVLSKRLTQYGALSVAIAGISEGNSQNIVHTDLSPSYLDGGIDSGTPSHSLNLNSDSLNDFNFNGLSAPAVIVNASPGSNSFLADGYGYPFALNTLDPINSSQTTWLNAYNNVGILNVLSCFNAASHWCNVTDKFLGVRFKIGTGTHYGWVKLDVNALGSSFTIKEYAYVDTPNIGLTAGQTTLGIDDAQLSKIKVVALHKSIGLYNLRDHTNYKLLNMTGQEVLKGSANQDDYVIEATSLASGVYILELSDKTSYSFFRKKVVLQ